MQAYVIESNGGYKVMLWDGDGADKWVTTRSAYNDARDVAYWMNEGFKYAGTYRRMPD